MKATSIRYLPETLLAISLCFLFTGAAFAGSAPDSTSGNGAKVVPFQASDDWAFADPSILIPHLVEAVSCPGAELSIDFQQPCPPGVNIKIRDLAGSSMMVSTDPRMTGMLIFTINANFDPEFSGAVWGTWSLDIEDGPGVWDGTWNGQRRTSMDPEECLGITPCWVGELRLVGHGSGGIVKGLQVISTERVLTFSPLPAPYENVCQMIFGESCYLEEIAEGILTGRILEPGKHK